MRADGERMGSERMGSQSEWGQDLTLRERMTLRGGTGSGLVFCLRFAAGSMQIAGRNSIPFLH